jgi:H+/Cl- antiporter ClcA
MKLKAEIQADLTQQVRIWPGVSSLMIGMLLVLGVVSLTRYLESEAIIEPDSVIGLAIGHPQVMYFSLFAICILGVALGFVGVVDARHASRLKQSKDGVQLRYAAAIIGGLACGALGYGIILNWLGSDS